MDAISYLFKAVSSTLRESMVSIFLLSQTHKVANYKAAKGIADWGKQDGDFDFDPKSFEIKFKDE